MAIDRNNRDTFEEAADLYDEVASIYPDELVKDILSLSGIVSKGKILEIGCGPGNATILFARKSYRILGIELGERLAAIAIEKCRSYPGVKILNMAFEDWKLEERVFDIALAADAFHWIPPEVGYPKVARALKDTGSLDFFWRVPVNPETDWSRAINYLYQEIAPQFINPDKRFTAEWLVGIVTKNIEASGCFGEVTTKQYFWPTSLTGDQYIKGLRTFSMHKDMKKEMRENLYTRILEVIEQFGGKVVQPNSVVLFHSRVKR
jgi:SAM-dependent methyltransferase